MTKKIYILVGAPGSGKSWVANQIQDQYTYVAHDLHGIKNYSDYVRTIKAHAAISDKPVLCDTPFSLKELHQPLLEGGFEVQPVFILEKPSVTRARYEARDGKPIPQGHITRIETYRKRASELQAPAGTSDEILAYMRNPDANKERVAAQRPEPRIEYQAYDAKRNDSRDQEAQRTPIPHPEPEAVRDVRPWTMGTNLWQKD